MTCNFYVFNVAIVIQKAKQLRTFNFVALFRTVHKQLTCFDPTTLFFI